MNGLSNFVLRVVFGNYLIHSNYAFSAELQFDRKSVSEPDRYGLL